MTEDTVDSDGDDQDQEPIATLEVPEDELIGAPLDDVPKLDAGSKCYARRIDRDGPENVFDGYCRQPAGCRTDHSGSGRCWLHGGGSLTGEEHPNYKHGLYAQLDESTLDDDDLELLEAIDATDNPRVLEQVIAMHGVRYRRAYEALADREGSPISVTDDGDLVLKSAEGQLAGLGGKLGYLINLHNRMTEGEQLTIDQTTEVSGSASISVEWADVDIDELEDDQDQEGEDD